MDFEKVKDFARAGFLLKEITNCKTPLCPFSIQAKQCRTSILSNATGGSIKSGDLKLGAKISCDQYQSREPGIIYNNNGQVLLQEYTTCSKICIDYASDFIFNFTQTSTDGKQTVNAKHKFKIFAQSYGIKIKHYHIDKKILIIIYLRKAVFWQDKPNLSMEHIHTTRTES